MISQTSEYALRVLLALAHAPGRSMRGHDLAQRTRVPEKYLSKLMLVMRDAGLLTATRGLGGGYHLLHAPDQVRVFDVVQLFEPLPAAPNCFLDCTRKCSEEHPCTAHPLWKEVQTSYSRFMLETRLSDFKIAHTTEPAEAELSSY